MLAFTDKNKAGHERVRLEKWVFAMWRGQACAIVLFDKTIRTSYKIILGKPVIKAEGNNAWKPL